MSYRGLGTDSPKVATSDSSSDRRDFWREMGLTAVANLPGTIQAVRGGGSGPLPGAEAAPYPMAPVAEPPPDNTLLVVGVVGGVALLGVLAFMSRRR